MQLSKKHNNQQGLGLIEVLIAVMTTALMLTAVAILLTMSLRNSAEARYRDIATSESQEVIEYLRRQKFILGWELFWDEIDSGSEPTYFCITGDQLNPPGLEWLPPESDPADCAYAPIDDTTNMEFKRILTVEIDRTSNPPTSLTATSETFWRVGTEEKSVSLQQLFTEYQ